ncbi:hypothetical protein [Methylobacter sp.]|uniref:hypothetical protein n=1 Tax=Methylobacter sp. TaxID=2051955 RepID=UPI0011F697FB|nr:hypothetical protein [Methylobacter sp.]TAK59520.1 MAG: hypothetical protein EPO18_20375 [Methylobacter sp.]
MEEQLRPQGELAHALEADAASTGDDAMIKKKLTSQEKLSIERHGDQLYSWFREKFKGHPDALTKKECRDMFRYAIEDAR